MTGNNNPAPIDSSSIPYDLDPATKKLWWIASMYLKTGMGIPKGSKSQGYGKAYKTVEEVFIILYTGHSFGMNEHQSLSNIRLQGGKMSIWGDAVPALAYRTGEVEDFHEEFEGVFPNDDFKAICTIKRKGVASEKISTFSVSDAKRAGLWSANVKSDEEEGFDKTSYAVGKNFWHQYPRRMLQMRARAFALRDSFPDALGGFYISEELIDDDEEQPIIVHKVNEPSPAPIAIPKESKKDFMAMLSKLDETKTLNASWEACKGVPLEKDTASLKELYKEALAYGFFRDGTSPKKNEFRDWLLYKSALVEGFLRDFNERSIPPLKESK